MWICYLKIMWNERAVKNSVSHPVEGIIWNANRSLHNQANTLLSGFVFFLFVFFGIMSPLDFGYVCYSRTSECRHVNWKLLTLGFKCVGQCHVGKAQWRFFFSSFFVVNSVSFHFNWILSPIQKSEIQYFETQNHEPGFPITSFCSKYKSGLKQHKDTQHHRNSFFCMCWDRRWTIVLRFLVIIWHVYERNLFSWKTACTYGYLDYSVLVKPKLQGLLGSLWIHS